MQPVVGQIGESNPLICLKLIAGCRILHTVWSGSLLRVKLGRSG
jgi:hypothetical protein